MSRDLKNKIVVITGGADGIGFQIGEYFLKNGAKTIIIADINEKTGLKAADKFKFEYGASAAEFIQCDVTKDLDKFYRDVTNKYKVIDILVNNAGISSSNEMRKVIEIYLVALIDWSKRFHDYMRVDKGGKGGTIINISSIYGFRSDGFAEIYCASKHGVLGYTKCLGHKDNFNLYGVRVIAICPGYTETNLTASAINGDFKEFKEFHTTSMVWQKAEDVGKAAVEIYERADSGTAWIIEGAKPIEELKPSDQ